MFNGQAAVSAAGWAWYPGAAPGPPLGLATPTTPLSAPLPPSARDDLHKRGKEKLKIRILFRMTLKDGIRILKRSLQGLHGRIKI